MDPLKCPECQKIFMANPLLQAEMLHTAVKEGESASRIDLRERLAEEHINHGRPDTT